MDLSWQRARTECSGRSKGHTPRHGKSCCGIVTKSLGHPEIGGTGSQEPRAYTDELSAQGAWSELCAHSKLGHGCSKTQLLWAVGVGVCTSLVSAHPLTCRAHADRGAEWGTLLPFLVNVIYL